MESICMSLIRAKKGVGHGSMDTRQMLYPPKVCIHLYFKKKNLLILKDLKIE